jgi:acetyltransferase-like isoleucine patch superfamily enzyme
MAMPGCQITIGDNTVWNRRCFVRASERTTISIGRGCLFSDVTIETSDMHSVLDAATGERLNPAQNVVVGDRCWLGSGVLVLPGAVLGADTVVGARAVVTYSFPPNVVLAGVPAKVVKEGIMWARDRL